MKTRTKTFSARPFEQIDMARKKQIAFGVMKDLINYNFRQT